eukprot:15799321-Heterocapsa_arctica.AAC.1
MNLGLHLTIFAYNIFAVSVLSYLWQLCTPPPELLKAQDSLLRKLVPGPGDWIHKEDLFVLHSELGFPSQFESVRDKALAAKLRLVVKERISPAVRWVDIQRSLVHFGRYCEWLPWYRHSFYRQLADALEEANGLNISPSD